MNEEQLLKIKSALNSLNIPHKFIGVIPFSHEITSDEPLEGVNYLPYGSTLLTKLATEKNWVGCYFNLSKFTYEIWNYHRNDMLNDGVYTIDEAIEVLSNVEPDSHLFTRPCEDLKQFSGTVIQADECVAWFKDAKECASSGSYQLSGDTKVIISKPKNILMEWRWFVVNSRVISGSIYRRNGQLFKQRETDQEVIDEAQRFATKWLPHKNCVMDLCLLDTGELKVIEFNCINSSGFYENDVESVINALWMDFVN